MKTLRYAAAMVIFAVQFVIFPVAGNAIEVSNLRHLSEADALAFMECARNNTVPNGTCVGVAFKLSKAGKTGTEKYGSISYERSATGHVFRVNFDEDARYMEFGSAQLEDNACAVPMHEPFFEGLIFTPADVFFFFLEGNEYSYIGPSTIAGRRVQEFLMQTDISIGGTRITHTKISIDEKFMAVLRVDFFDGPRKVARRISVGSFKNFDGIWMPKTVEIADFRNRSRARLHILSVKT
ncbi:MAG: hypothetical protein LBT64_00770 [Puniceicoccales bacterium]|jgi:hypothetical protein|nr:hypothetical protein [Puniceicoccales bacterium]